MNHRILVSAALAVAAVGGGTALAASGGTTATVTASSGSKFVINKYAQDTAHYTPGVATIKSGGTLTLKDKGGAPHTFSIVKASQLPKTTKQIEGCKVCESIGKAHGADPNSDAPPKQLLVDVGAKGVDQAGDSVFFMKTQKLKITAKPGTTLYFMCAIHPWMQGKLQVK